MNCVLFLKILCNNQELMNPLINRNLQNLNSVEREINDSFNFLLQKLTQDKHQLLDVVNELKNEG